jgi:hypothetical protein
MRYVDQTAPRLETVVSVGVLAGPNGKFTVHVIDTASRRSMQTARLRQGQAIGEMAGPSYDLSQQTIGVFSNAPARHEFVFVSPIGLNLLPNAFIKANEPIVGHRLEAGWTIHLTRPLPRHCLH